MAGFISPLGPLHSLHTGIVNEPAKARRGVRVQRVDERSPEERGSAPAAVAELSEFEKHYVRAFPRFDAACSGGGVLGESELQSLVLSKPALMGQGDDDAALARTLQDHAIGSHRHGMELFYKLESIVERTETSDPLGRVRRHEVEVPLRLHVPVLSRLYKQEYRFDVFEEEYVDEFSDWNTQSGRKGYLLAADIDQLMEDPVIHGDSAVALATLKEMLRGGLDPGHSLLFLPTSIHRVLADGSQIKANYLFNQRLLLGQTWNRKKAILARSVRTVLATPLPDWLAVTQGGFSDCYLEACLVAYVRQRPDAIRNMLAGDPQLGYQVRFAHGTVMTVAPPTDAQLAVYANSADDGMWATVIDKAWQRLPERSLSMLTGRPARVVRAPFSADLVRKILQLSVPEGGAAVVGGGSDSEFQYYAVTGFETATDTVTLRNPWHPGSVPGGGLFNLSAAAVAERCTVVEADIV